MTVAERELVTDGQVRFFRENGYLYYGPMFSEQEQRGLRDEVQCFIDGDYPDVYRTDLWPEEGEDAAPVGHERFLQMCMLWKLSDVIRKYAIDRRRGQIIAALVGVGSIRFLSDMVLYKPPGKGKSRQSIWHQDFPTGYNTLPDITSWMPLDDVGHETGCMQYIPGSHKLGELTLPGEQCRENYEKAGIDFSNSAIVPMKAGEVMFHHSNILHYSAANNTDRPRRVYITRYMPANAVYRNRPAIQYLYPDVDLAALDGQPFADDEYPIVYP